MENKTNRFVSLLVGLLFGLVVLFAFSSRANTEERNLLVLSIDNKIITPALSNYFQKSIESGKADALLILIDTPGGFLEACQEMVKTILSADIPTLAYVYPKGARAGSAGVFISLACDFVAMAPNTRIGAAHPIMASNAKIDDLAFAGENKGQETLPANKETEQGYEKGNEDITKEERGMYNRIESSQEEILSEKVINDVLAFFRSYVTKKRPGIDIGFAETLITKSSSLTEEEALKHHIIDVVCEDIDCVIRSAQDRGILESEQKYRVVYKKMQPVDVFMYYVTNPYVLYLLSSLSLVLLLFEFTHPGFGLPGIVGLVGVGICMYGYGVLPVNYFGLFLLVLGVLFFIIEAFTPGIGLLAGAGIISFIWGSLILWATPGSMFSIPISLILSIGVLLGLMLFGLVSLVIFVKTKRPLLGSSAMIGKKAKVVEDVGPDGGRVFINGEYWDAVSSQGVIPRGKEVLVEGVEGLVLKVKGR